MKKYYTYVLLDPFSPGHWEYENYTFGYEPFYIGKGTGDRCDRHVKESCKLIIKGYSHISHKNHRIISILERDSKPIVIKLDFFDTEDEAYSVEDKMVAHFKRQSEGGILTNIIPGRTS